jgi:hypothetical protein
MIHDFVQDKQGAHKFDIRFRPGEEDLEESEEWDGVLSSS